MSENCGGLRINRDYYLNQLIDKQLKIITGLRRSGKSYLLGEIYKQYLNKSGIEDNQIIIVELDDEKNDSLLEKKKLIKTFAYNPIKPIGIS